MRVHDNGTLGHLHFGAALAAAARYAHLGRPASPGSRTASATRSPLEYPTTGTGDFRIPALTVEHADGSTVLDLAYREHRILARQAGRPRATACRRPTSRPTTRPRRSRSSSSTRRAASRVELCLHDLPRPPGRSPAAPGSATTGTTTVRLTGAMSAAARPARCALGVRPAERRLGPREPRRRPAASRPGRQSVGSDRGASSHQHNPFIALRRPTTTEDAGEAYGFSLVYSGNFLAEAEVDPFDTTRVRLGISPNTFTWTPRAGRRRSRRPEAVLVYSDAGLGAMSDAFHGLYRERLARGTWRDRPRPVLHQQLGGRPTSTSTRPKLVAIATAARDLGVELFVLDDGWFGAARRRHDRRSATGSSTGASCRTASTASPRRSRRSASSSGCGSSPRWSASGAGCSRRTRTGRSASRAGRGPRAASSSSSTCRGRRSSTTCSASCPRSSPAPRSRTSSGT